MARVMRTSLAIWAAILGAGLLTGCAARPSRPHVDALQELRTHVTVAQVGWKVGDPGDGSATVGWMVTLHNDWTHPAALTIAVQFEDEDGFVVDRTTSDVLFVQANADRTVTGAMSMSSAIAVHVAHATAAVALATP